ncbi:Hint domain-containing protein [Coralliovum pocilloporae]|uniref:Hint domain-containing protein n=1 Tax=Coralliovum pocilloporae TaxID=3066369 RepID=UPI0033078B8D
MSDCKNEDTHELLSLSNELDDNSPIILNPAIPIHKAVIKRLLNLSGKTEKTHPRLFQHVEDGASSKPNSDTAQQLHIVDSGADTCGRATARVWHHHADGSLMSGSLALAMDPDTGEILAQGYGNRVGGGLTPAATRTASAKPAPANVRTIGFSHTVPESGAAPQFALVSNVQPAALNVQTVPATIDAPKIIHTGNGYIEIGLGRQQTGVDLDYFYPQDTNNTPILLVPFVGNVNTQQPLNHVDPNTGNFTQGLGLTTRLYSVTGKSYSQHESSQSITSQVTGNTSTNVVSWSYPFNANDDSTSLQYQPLAAARDTVSAFFFQFVIPVNNIAAPTFTFNVCSYDWPEQPSVNCVQIANLKFWWHCVAADAAVTLEDGSHSPLEQVDNTKRVRTAHGGGLGVEATTRGLHKVAGSDNPLDAVLELHTRSGFNVILTGGHPVMTPNGLVHACDLKQGMPVITEEGVDSVVFCQPSDYDGVFCNLKLVDEHDRRAGLGGTVGTFFVNGIAVGDFESMETARHANTHSLDYMLPRLSEEWHQDYASTLRMIHEDNAKYGTSY